MIQSRKDIESTKEKKKSGFNSIESSAQSGAAHEVVNRYGSASKEHLVAYSGRDNEFDKTLKRGLNKTAQSKVNPDFEKQNIKQQAGFAAEDKYTARQNTEKIISGSKDRYRRTDDLGRVNDPLFDHVLLDSEGIEIPGTGEQMKFVGSNPKDCLNLLQSEKFKKYLDANASITVPSDYYEDIIQEASKKIQSLEIQLDKARKEGNVELERSISEQLKKLRKIKQNIKNSGITNREAIFARTHPELSTAEDIVKISHRAGIEQAKTGAIIGGSLSLIKNLVEVTKGNKKAEDAAIELVKDTGKGAVAAYTTAFAGSAVKAGMQNAKSSMVRALSETNAPAAIVTSTIDISKTLIRYMKGEISGTDCLTEIGEKGAGGISSAMFTIVGQSVIPIPIVGAMVGSIVGYALSSTYYHVLLDSLKKAQLAHQERLRIEAECEESIQLIRQYKIEMNNNANKYLKHCSQVFDMALKQMDDAFLSGDIDKFIGGANKITVSLGGTTQFSTMEQFDDFMESDQEFNL